jgi:hypothetical protein
MKFHISDLLQEYELDLDNWNVPSAARMIGLILANVFLQIQLFLFGLEAVEDFRDLKTGLWREYKVAVVPKWWCWDDAKRFRFYITGRRVEAQFYHFVLWQQVCTEEPTTA